MNTEEKIIECLEEIKKIVKEHITDVQMSIASMQSKIKPHEEFLQGLPTVEVNFHYENSTSVKKLVQEIQDIQTNN